MRIVERERVNIQKWNTLVESSNDATVFSLSYYLDAVAENWCVLVDDSYSKGIALPYSIRLGVKCLYTPIFSRYLELLGAVDLELAVEKLKNYFPEANFSFRTQLPGLVGEEFVYQQMNSLKLNQQAKRMIQKFDKSKIEIKQVSDSKAILKLIEDELSEKVDIFDKNQESNIVQLVNSLTEQKLMKVYGFYEGDGLVGGMLFIEFNKRIIYLKGASKNESKSAGVMYACMYNEILISEANGCCFDFGGSRIEGVRRFNLNFGSEDIVYYNYEWHLGPLWFKTMKGLRKLWKK